MTEQTPESGNQTGNHDEKMKPDTVELYFKDGPTTTVCRANIDGTGSLVVEGHDMGSAPREIWHDHDYEWATIVKAENKDRVLLALIEQIFKGEPDAPWAFKKWLEEKGIPGEFCSWG